jgi:hypothetical protein
VTKDDIRERITDKENVYAGRGGEARSRFVVGGHHHEWRRTQAALARFDLWGRELHSPAS